MDNFYSDLLKKDNVRTPSTSQQPPAPRRERPARRRALALDDDNIYKKMEEGRSTESDNNN